MSHKGRFLIHDLAEVVRCGFHYYLRLHKPAAIGVFVSYVEGSDVGDNGAFQTSGPDCVTQS